MKIVQVTHLGKPIAVADCDQFVLHRGEPSCRLGINPMACESCTQGSPRQSLTPRPVPSIALRAASWAKAEASALVQSLTDQQIEARIAACLACEHRDAGEPVGWCKRCGCGRSAAAELSRKARLPAAACPASRWASI
jgi:hypothetical protein